MKKREIIKGSVKNINLITVMLLILCLSVGCQKSAVIGSVLSEDSGNEATISATGKESTEDSYKQTAQTGSSQVAYTAYSQAAEITVNVKDSDLDSAWSATGSTVITLNGASAQIEGSGATVDGSTVTITKAGTYVISGKLSKGQILINATKDDIVRIILNGVDITADTNAAIYAAVADKVILTIADGTENTVTDNASYVYSDAEKEEPNAAIFAKCDMTINGTGTLNVTGRFNHGIATKDDLVIVSSNIMVDAVNAALRGKDSVTILDGVFDLTTKEGDGIKTDNETDVDKGWIYIKSGKFTINSYNDGIQATSTLKVDGGEFNITTGGGWPGGSFSRGSHATTNEGVVAATKPSDGSYKGIKGVKNIEINGGTFIISSYDDSVHSNGDVVINSGEFTIKSGDDGIHADNALIVNDGIIDIENSFEGIEGVVININGGKINVYSTDDGINAGGSSSSLTVTGGVVYVNSGGDGIDSNANIEMTGGEIYVDGPTTSGDGAVDYQGQFKMSGGILMAASQMDNQAPGASSGQPSILLYFSSGQKAGAQISVKSADGTLLASHSPQKDFRSIAISAPNMKINETYTIYLNDAELTQVTLAQTVTSISDTGEAINGFGMGGRGMGGGMGDMGSMGNQGNKPVRPGGR